MCIRDRGCTDPVSSPTFAIVNYYRGPRPLAHFDLYRISTENDLCAAGFYDYLDQGAVAVSYTHLEGYLIVSKKGWQTLCHP